MQGRLLLSNVDRGEYGGKDVYRRVVVIYTHDWEREERGILMHVMEYMRISFRRYLKM